jgi:transcriptional regulator with XRE-family HTH domain
MKSSIEMADESFAKNVKDRREELEMTQAELAQGVQELGYSFRGSTVYKIEAGLRKATVGEANAIASALHTDLEELLGLGTNVEVAHARAIGKSALAVLAALAEVDRSVEDLGASHADLRRCLEAASQVGDAGNAGSPYFALGQHPLGVDLLVQWRTSTLGDKLLSVLLSDAGIRVGDSYGKR